VKDVSERFVTTRSGVKVHIVEAGDASSPPVIFVPGWACTAWVFNETLVPFASDGFHAIAVELKGHGLSDKPSLPDEYTLEAMRDHLLEIIDALGVERCGVVGHSMGAAISGAAAHSRPDKISRLALAAPVGFSGVRGMKFFRAITPKFLEPVFPKIASRWFVRMMLNVVYGSLRRPTQEDVEQFHSPLSLPGSSRALRNLLHYFNWNAPFPKLSIPALIIVGDEDVLSPLSDLDAYPAQSVVVEGSGHVLFEEAPEKVNALLSEFFAPMRYSYISSRND